MATTINLLPWRQLQRAEATQRTTSFIQAAFCMGLAIAAVFYLHVYLKMQDAQQALATLTKEIQISDKKIVDIQKYKAIKEALIARMKVVHQLQSSRILTVHLFDELANIMLDGIYLMSVQRVGDRIIVHGYAESNTYVSQLMRNIEKSKWIDDPILTEIKRDKTENDKTNLPSGNEFRLSFTVTSKALETQGAIQHVSP